MITCQLCGLEFKSMITNSHLKYKHNGITLEQYMSMGHPAVTKDYVDWRRDRYTEYYNHPDLGVKSDHTLSTEWGIPRKTVSRIRNRQGIIVSSAYAFFQEGIPARSALEAMYDCYLHELGISHEHEYFLGEYGVKFVADFKVGSTFIEIAGMEYSAQYDKQRERKENFYKTNNLEVLWLLPEQVKEMYKRCRLQVPYRQIKVCTVCSTENKYLNKGKCKACYDKYKRKKQSDMVTLKRDYN